MSDQEKQTQPVRFGSIRAVRQHLAAGRMDPAWRRPARSVGMFTPTKGATKTEHQQLRLDRESANTRTEFARTAQISSHGNFFVNRWGRTSKWHVYHCGSGLILTLGDGEGNAASALGFANALEQARDLNGEPFDWRSPYVGDRLNLIEGRAFLGEIIARGQRRDTLQTSQQESAAAGVAEAPEVAAPSGEAETATAGKAGTDEVRGRFADAAAVLGHWRRGADNYRVSETKHETETRISGARRRADRVQGAELVGDGTLMIGRSFQNTTRTDRWFIYHSGTALPVLRLEPSATRENALGQARDLIRWQDSDGTAFEWGSEGLQDRLHSPLGVRMTDTVKGRDPEARWSDDISDSTDTTGSVEVGGLEYRYRAGHRAGVRGSVVDVYAPDGSGSLIGRGISDFDIKTRKSATVGVTRDGRRVPGRGAWDFATNVARQHQLAQKPMEEQDELWVHFTDSSAHVHGTVKGDTEMKSLLRSCGFTWSGHAEAYVTASTTRSVTRSQGVDRLVAALARQDRLVEIRRDEDRLRATNSTRPVKNSARTQAAATGVEPATPIHTAASSSGGSAVEAAPAEEAAPEPGEDGDVSALTDEELIAAIEDAGGSLSYSGFPVLLPDPTRGRKDALQKEREERALRRLEDVPDVAGMSQEDLEAEHRIVDHPLMRNAFAYGADGYRSVRERERALSGEIRAYAAREMLNGPAPQDLGDEALDKAYNDALVMWARLPPKSQIEKDVGQFRDALLVEKSDRRVAHYEQRTAVGELTFEDLAAETRQLDSGKEESALSGRAEINNARVSRREAVDAEIERRESEEHAPALARAKVRKSYSDRRDVHVDGMRDAYGHISETYRGFQATTSYLYGVKDLGKDFRSRPAAVAALVRRYDQDPETLPERTWGGRRGVTVPVGAVDVLAGWMRPRVGQEASPEWRRLYELLTPREFPTQEKHGNPLTGKVMRAYTLYFEEGLLAELARVVERATTDLREQSINTELPRKERDAAKRRIPTMGATLHDIEGVRGMVREAGGSDDRRGVDANKVAAQLSALADSVTETEQEGDGGEPVRAEGEGALGEAPAQRAGRDGEPGEVLRGQGGGDASGDLHGGGSAGGGDGAGDRLSAAGRAAESDPGHGRAAGDGRAPAAAGGPGDGGGLEPHRGRFRPDPAATPAGPLARAAANLEAVKVTHRLEAERRGASLEEKHLLARWSGWGSVPLLFWEEPDPENPVYGQGGEREGRFERDFARWDEYSTVRGELREYLDPFKWREASRATLSAHYTPQAVAEAMWAGLGALGFDGGEVLEAGFGSGTFCGVAPDGARLTGVELDSTAARIAQRIYPEANVLIESFADTDTEVGTFDAAVGNVPFAEVPFTERRYGAAGESLHNGFLLKQLALTRPGGVVAVITSRWTLDAQGDDARRKMARYGDLLGAVRLPAGTFAATAGTDVTTDVLVFRRRDEDEEAGDQTWLEAPERELNGSQQTVNAYFDQHPEHVLGTLTTASGPYGPKLSVQGDPSRAAEQLREALSGIAADAVAAGRGYLPHPEGPDREPLNLQTAREKHANDYTGRLYADENGQLWQHINGNDPVKVVCSDGNTSQLRELMRMRDVAAELKDLDRSGDEPERSEELRGRLRELHGTYTQAYGPLSRPRQTRMSAPAEARALAKTEGREVREDERTPTAWGWFREDPDAACVLGLEHWDRRAEKPVVSDVLTRRPGTRETELEHTDDPDVALSAVMRTTGRVDLDSIGELLGTDRDEARRRMGTRVFDDPSSGLLEHAGAYLSGRVRHKLDVARAAARRDPAYAVNVTALEEVQPKDKKLGEFTPQLGAHWIPPTLVQGFLRSFLKDPVLRVDHNERYGWSLAAGKVPDAVNALHGTKRRTALQIARAVLGRGSLIVEDVYGDGAKVISEVNEDATRAVRQKAAAMRAAFEEYATADSDRVRLLTESYNRVMNAHVIRNYDGLAPSLEGLTPERTPFKVQLAAAARMQFERGVLLNHEVGVGKTTSAIIGTQALKASGQIHKPFAVMQDHISQQWFDEARFLYPNADIHLVTSDDLAGPNRRRTLEWLRANSPDLTLFTEPAFTSIKMSPEYQEWYEFREIESLREQIKRERGVPDNAFAVMQLEKRIATHEARLRRNAAPMRTPGETYWNDLGFDYAVIDEIHRFKGIGFRSKVGGGDTANIRAVDLHQKVTDLHRRSELQGGKPTITGLTGTALNRSIFEEYTLLALTAPWVLDAYGVGGPDLWAETFGQTVPRIEMAPDGSGLKVVERFSRFISKTAMKTMWGLVADTVTADDAGIVRPKITGGKPQLHLVERTEDQIERLQALMDRGQAIHSRDVSRDEDNMLAVANDGRAVAVDPRLLDADAPPGGKLAAVADFMAEKYHANKDRIYAVSRDDPTPHPTPGGLLVGFLNMGTPGGKNRGNFDAYAELTRLLVARDVPAEKIAAIQDHNHNPEKLSELFRKCREGEVGIFLASSNTASTGVNIQNRAYGLVHIDPDYNPTGMIQRNGRVQRQGNQHNEVSVDFFGLENSMDAWTIGLCASKAEGLYELLRPGIADDGDTVEEIGESEWDFATMQAEIGGNPYQKQLMDAQLWLRGLESDRRNQAVSRLEQETVLEAKRTEAAATRTAIDKRAAALPHITDVRGEKFTATVGRRTYTKQKDAGQALRQAITTRLSGSRDFPLGTGPWFSLGRFGGLDYAACTDVSVTGELHVRVGFPDLRHSDAHYTLDELAKPAVGSTMFSRLATALEKAEEQQLLDRGRLPGLDQEVELLTASQSSAADYGPRIDHARQRVNLLDDIVTARVELDKVPELRPSQLAKYTNEDTRKRLAAEQTQKRAPLQELVDQAIDRLRAFDRDNPAPAAPAPQAPSTADSVTTQALDPLEVPEGQLSISDNEADIETTTAPADEDHTQEHSKEEATGQAGSTEDGTPEEAPPRDGQEPTASEEPAKEVDAGTEPADGNPLRSLMDGFGDRVGMGHIGAPAHKEREGQVHAAALTGDQPPEAENAATGRRAPRVVRGADQIRAAVARAEAARRRPVCSRRLRRRPRASPTARP